MTPFISRRTLGFALGGILAVMAGACSDVPSAPVKQFPLPQFPNPLAPRAADIPIIDAGLPTLLPGEKVRRRAVRLGDGSQYVLESVVDADGLPRDVRITQNGRLVARLRNEWRRTFDSFELDRQQLVRYADGSVPARFDSRQMGAVGALAGGRISFTRQVLLGVPAKSGDVRLAGRMRALEGEYFGDGGPCDGQARAVEDAIDNWLFSIITATGATLTGSPVAAWTAYAYQLRMYRALTRAEAALDQCVADAGKIVDMP